MDVTLLLASGAGTLGGVRPEKGGGVVSAYAFDGTRKARLRATGTGNDQEPANQLAEIAASIRHF